VRYTNVRSAEQYLVAVEEGRLPGAAEETLDDETLFSERLAMGLRLSTGVALEALCQSFGQPFGARKAEADRLFALGLVIWHGPFLRLTEKGVFLHSEISARLL
jgi:coproporphyrinogen III oxidase-like Fe-S oxidoreductase